MTKINFDLLTKWREAVQEIAELKKVIEAERVLRQQVFNAFFPSPVEGTNNFSLPHDWLLKGTYKIERKIDEPVLSGVQEQLRSAKCNPDLLFKYEPKLQLSVYRKLTDEQRHLADMAIIAKPGMPSLELVQKK